MRSATDRCHDPATVMGLAAICLAGQWAMAADTNLLEPAEYPIGKFTTGVTIADVDGDLQPDVITANSNTSDLSVLLNRGDGTLDPEIRYGGGGGKPREVAVGDLDGDGDADLVAAIRDGLGSIAVLLNRGDGTFSPAVQYDPPRLVFALVLRDLDDDLDLDVGVLHATLLGADVTVLLNRGDGTFGGGVTHHAIDSDIVYAADLVAADTDGDLRPDLIVASDCPITCGARSAVLKNAGAGMFLPAAPIDLGPIQSTGVAASDLDDDGDADLAVIDCSFGGNALVVALNDGSGRFAVAGRHPAGSLCHSFTTPVALAVGDVNLDGSIDVVLASHRDDRVRVLRNRGDATFDAPLDFGTGVEPLAVAVGDLDGDERPDVATANLAGITTPGTLSILLNDTEAPLSADLNGDGAVDVADLLILLAAWGVCPPAPDPCPADINGDGTVDVTDLLVLLADWG